MHLYNKGAEWRKWDLHVHTPASIVHNYKSEDGIDIWEKFVCDIEALPDEIKVIGINDYIFIDGYIKILAYQSEGRMSNIEMFLPVIELRLAKFSGNTKFKRINYHVIFSNDIRPEVIQSQFLNGLSTHYVLDPGINQDWWGGCIDHNNLSELGKKIINSVPENERANYHSELKEGFNNLNLNIEQIDKVLNNYHGFNGKYITAIGKTEWDEFSWSDNSIGEKKTIINSVDIIFTASKSVEAFYNAKNKLKINGVKNTLLDCSDAHNNINSTDKDRLGNCNTWIKADPTFEGLKQVLNEFDDRVFIGEKPSLFEKINQHKTKYIDSIKTSPISSYSNQLGKWFDFDIKLNPELVAIIGNKGSGKSAIADMIALCCNQSNQNDFSFLKKGKFRDGKLAQNFETTITFCNEAQHKKNLNDSNVNNITQLVKYLPQGYFERLCNEISKVEEFRTEIESVVFQYIDETDRLGTSNFQDLIHKKSKSIEAHIDLKKQNLNLLIENLISFEKKENVTYKKEIEDKKKQKEEELNALIKPQKIDNPNDIPEIAAQNIEVVKNIENIKENIENLDCKIEQKKEDKNNLSKDVQVLRNLKASISQAVSNIQSIIDTKDISIFELEWDNIISFKYDSNIIDSLINNKNETINLINKELGLDESNTKITSLITQKEEFNKSLVFEQNRLSGPLQEYQQYLNNLTIYNNRKAEINGKSENPSVDTLNWLITELNYIDNQLQYDISKKYDEIIDITIEIYASKNEIVSIYSEVKNKIDGIIAENKELLEDTDISIDASILLSIDFERNILNYINKRVKGSFMGSVDSSMHLTNITELKDVNNYDDVKGIINEIRDSLKTDCRDGQTSNIKYIGEQVNDMNAFYNYLFSLDYLNYNYNLKQNNKPLENLSPGEKGSLLLVFYLIIDMDNRPLILDQPEDNLDNASVANFLVKFIKKAKSRRQIIMVTHNPNLAVVADAEQIIYVNIDKQDKNTFSFDSGSIENPKINKHIVDVLEGAMPAFRKRDNKYYDVK